MAHSNEYVEELKILHNKKTFGVTKGIPLVVNKLIEEKNIKSFLDLSLRNTKNLRTAQVEK